MSKFFVTNPETGHSYHCGCENCLMRARARLLTPHLTRRLPTFDPGDLLDFSKMPWPDELLAKKKKSKE